MFTPVALLQDIVAAVAIGAVLLFFKPLLSGIFRALVLVVRPHLSREQLAARAHMRDAQSCKE